MEKPDVDLTTLSIGKIFQIDPEGKEPIQVNFGGDFLISTAYEETHVFGYLASVMEVSGVIRFKGLAFLKAPWRLIECVGSVNWYKKVDVESENAKI